MVCPPTPRSQQSVEQFAKKSQVGIWDAGCQRPAGDKNPATCNDPEGVNDGRRRGKRSAILGTVLG